MNQVINTYQENGVTVHVIESNPDVAPFRPHQSPRDCRERRPKGFMDKRDLAEFIGKSEHSIDALIFAKRLPSKSKLAKLDGIMKPVWDAGLVKFLVERGLPKIYSVLEAAIELDIDHTTLTKLIRTGKVDRPLLNKCPLHNHRPVAAYIESQLPGLKVQASEALRKKPRKKGVAA